MPSALPTQPRDDSSTSPPHVDLFGHEGQSHLYSLYRPTYPPSLITRVLERLQTWGVKKEKLVDVACGTGQVTSLQEEEEEEEEEEQQQQQQQ